MCGQEIHSTYVSHVLNSILELHKKFMEAEAK
jgi:hypothetical protein